jgi:small subunit ribosomal protein S27e
MSKFIKVRCKKCKNEQIIFEKSSSEIRCLVCKEILSTPTGGKSKVTSKVLEIIN